MTMLGEDNRLEVVNRRPLGRGGGIEGPKRCSLFVVRRSFGAVEASIGFRGGDVDGGRYQDGWKRLEVREGRQVGASGLAEGGAAEEEIGDVAAELRSQVEQSFEFDGFVGQCRNGQEY